MQDREPTYLEQKLDALLTEVETFCKDDDIEDPLAALVAHILVEDSDECGSAQDVLASDPLLKAGRAYFSLLTENDKLPPGEQLSAHELILPRALLLDFFLGRSNIQQRAQEVLALIERKFSERAFQQATILLQLFETDQATRIQNERKLFYEDMIQRLGVRRRQPLSDEEVERVRDHFSEVARSLSDEKAFEVAPEKTQISLADLFIRHPAEEPIINAASYQFGEDEEDIAPEDEDDTTDTAAEDEADGDSSDASASADESVPLRAPFLNAETVPEFSTLDAAPGDDTPDPLMPLCRSLDWLANEHQIHFCLQLRSPRELARWERVARCGDLDKATQMLRQVPPLRWRMPSDYDDMALLEAISRHLTTAAIREHIRSLTRACYFVLLAVGDTGLEDYLEAYFGWLDEHLSLDGTVFIDRLHRESTLGEQTLMETLDSIYDEHFAGPMTGLPYSFTEADILQAIEAFTHQMRDADLSEVAPGFFDLGAFIIDQLMKVPYPSLEFSFRLHRIA